MSVKPDDLHQKRLTSNEPTTRKLAAGHFSHKRKKRPVKAQYRLFKRGNYFYAESAATGKQESLHTKNETEARRLLAAKNEAANNSQLTMALGKTYLTAIDPKMMTRTWAKVIEFVTGRGGKSTQERCQRALAAKPFEPIRNKPILETTSADFLNVLSDGKQSTNHYLRLLQSAALDLGWLAGKPILAKKCWPKVTPRTKRALTWDEHCKIASAEKNQERRLYYEILWETGASQTDASLFSNANVDWSNRTLVYNREKTGQQASIRIGTRLDGPSLCE